MSTQVLVTNLISSQNASYKNNRPSSTSFLPSLWRDHFIKHSPDFTVINYIVTFLISLQSNFLCYKIMKWTFVYVFELLLQEIDATTQQEYEDLKHEVRTMLDDSTSDHSTKLRSINAVQLLGIDYHFKREIEDALQRIYHDGDTYYDFYTAALWFRLLRQQGIKVSSG